jgi:hypothetical protein
MFDKEFLDAIMKSAGIGAAIGWAIQFFMWKEERTERKEAHSFILTMLDKVTTEKVQGTNAITSLTAAVNAIIELVRGGRQP